MAAAKHQVVEDAYNEARARSEAAKEALAQAQEAYDELSDQFDAQEAPLERSIEDLEAQIVEFKDEIAQLGEVISTARKRRQFCDSVYQYPDETASLRRDVEADEATAHRMQQENDMLRDQLEQSKAQSKKAKIAIAIVIVLVVVIVAAFVVTGLRAG